MAIKRNKPIFLRQGWNRYIRLGKQIKKKRKWRAAVGGDSKTRLKERGKPIRPTIGWGSDKSIRGLVNGMVAERVENLMQLEKVQKGHGIIVAHVGEKKRKEIIAKANEKGIKILNKYKVEKNATQK